MTPADLEFTEPERYELSEPPRYHFEGSRRDFLQILGAGVLISTTCPAPAQRSRRGRSIASPAQRLHIGADGTITVLTGKVEVGQGSRTQITQAAAEELEVPLDRIKVIMADSELVPDDGGTAGSRTTPSTVPAVRKACAVARQMLLAKAAERFGVNVNKLSVRSGAVRGLADDVTFAYANLVNEENVAPLSSDPPSDVVVKRVANWRVLGTSSPRVDAIQIVTGRHRYPSDITRPGMLYGAVLRPPAYGAGLLEIDLEGVRAMGGVTSVRDGDFVGFAGPTTREAIDARELAGKTAKWKGATHPSSSGLFDHLRRNVSSERARRSERGNSSAALKDAPRALRRAYTAAYIQHAPMEPRAAVAEWVDGRLTVWTGTQQPSRVRSELARMFRIPDERVRLIVPDTGGGFGGKHTGEVAVEAARLARAANKPVSVRWSREEEFTWAYFRPAAVMDLAAGLDAEDRLTAWEHVNLNSGSSAIATPYDCPNYLTEFKRCNQPLRSGSYRALASTVNVFARESMMDELALLAGVNPLEFRLKHLSDERLKAVLVAAAEGFRWKQAWKKQEQQQPTGVGLACGIEKGSYVATCARVHVDPGKGRYKVADICQAYECGAIQNPSNLKAQVEGCIIQGLGAVLGEAMEFRDGRILNSSFSRYRVPRFRDLPVIQVVLVDRPDLPSVGGGETPIVGIAPAVANALAHATQSRIRSLPLRDGAYQPV